MNNLAHLAVRTFSVTALALLLNLSWTTANAQETCERTGIEFGFFNGVKTLEEDAQDVINFFLPRLYGHTTPDGQPISYTLYYNDTEGWADFVETFEQRLQEHNGVLSQRFELFFSSLQGGGSWWTHITETVPALGDVLSGIVQTFQAFLTNRLVEGTGDPSTAAVSQRHREQIDHAAAMDKGLLLFAHSQGNLFVNQAYDHALTRVGAESVRVVHVAPPSPRQIGNYTLANLDVVINLLRTTGFVLQNTQNILPYAHRPPGLNGQRDFLGHGLLEIYLNPLVPSTSAAIRWHVEQALAELRSPNNDAAAPYPPFVGLPWQGGTRPQPSVSFVETRSHALEELRESSSDGGRWTYHRLPAASHGRWSGGWGSQPRGFWDSYETRFTSHASGPGISGSLICTRSQTVVSGTETRTKRRRNSCVYNHYPARLFPYGRGAPWALRDSGPVPEGTVRQLNNASWGPSFSVYTQRYDSASNTYPRTVAFLDGEVTSEEITRYRRSPWSGRNDGFVLDETLLFRRTDTVRTSVEPFVYSSVSTSNLNAIAAWDAAYSAWITGENERYQAWSVRERAHRRRVAQCSVTPQPPTGGDCNIEDPRAACLQPS